MGCFAVPTIAAIIHGMMRKKRPAMQTPEQKWLSLLLVGGAVFGIVDHAWNGELFMLGPNPLMELLLGVAITAAIFVVWRVVIAAEKMRAVTAQPEEAE